VSAVEKGKIGHLSALEAVAGVLGVTLVQPDGVADQLRREAVAGVEGLGRARHGGLIPDPRPSGNPPRHQLDDALHTKLMDGKTALHGILIKPQVPISISLSRTGSIQNAWGAILHIFAAAHKTITGCYTSARLRTLIGDLSSI
jgi:hypothetical protein